MFKQGNKVVYPGHGVAIIEDIIEKSVGEKKIRFYKLKFLYTDMMILVPVDNNAQHVGLRSLCSEKDIDLAVSELHKAPKKLETLDSTPSSWNKRNKGYQLKIQGGNLRDIACIYRDLMYISRQKELSFGERNLLHSAEELLLQEILVVKRQDRNHVVQILRTPFKQYSFSSQANDQGHAAAAF